MQMEAEKRKISRAESSIKGQAVYKDKFFLGEIKNFSLTGFLFGLNETIDVSEGEKLIIMINLNVGEQEMMPKVNCTVIRKAGNILGLKFDMIDYDTLMILKEKLVYSIGDEDRINDEFISFLEGN